VQLEVLKAFPSFFKESDNVVLENPVTLTEIKDIIDQMPKDKSPGPDGWNRELFQNFFQLIGLDLLRVVEESHFTGVIP
jgi:hypothetical protein